MSIAPVILAIAAALIAAPSFAAPLPRAPVHVVDGDTLRMGDLRLRLHGIDAPELNQTCATPAGDSWPCGRWASETLANMVQGRRLDCQDLGPDRYGRRVARCLLDGRDIAAQMVSQGAALAYRRYSEAYVPQEAEARRAARGIWAAGPPTAPEAHRSASRATPAAAPDSACSIKGNIGTSGKIYHMPGQRDYAATRIDLSKGEAWFCSAAEARAAGFRPAQR